MQGVSTVSMQAPTEPKQMGVCPGTFAQGPGHLTSCSSWSMCVATGSHAPAAAAESAPRPRARPGSRGQTGRSTPHRCACQSGTRPPCSGSGWPRSPTPSPRCPPARAALLRRRPQAALRSRRHQQRCGAALLAAALCMECRGGSPCSIRTGMPRLGRYFACVGTMCVTASTQGMG